MSKHKKGVSGRLYSCADKTEFLLKKKDIIAEFNSPGTVECQIALLTSKINYISHHLRKHNKDFSTRIGLLKMVGKRKRLLEYLSKTNRESYLNLKSQLGIR